MINRKIKPKASGNIKFHLPEISKFKLSNGLNVLHVEKNNLPIINISFVSFAGSKYDSEDKRGIAYLTSMMIDEGAGDMSALEIDAGFESLGSVFGISADKDSIYLSLLSLTDNFPESFEIFSKIINYPHFGEAEFERERKKLLAQLLQAKDSAASIANSAFDKIIFRRGGYAEPIIGKYEHVDNLARRDVVSYYQNRVSPDNSFLVVVGGIDDAKLKEILDRGLGRWRNEYKTIDVEMNFESGKKKVYLINKEGSAQTELRIGHSAAGRKAPDFYSRYIANMILGGQFSSRLNLNLREKRGFTYGIHSNFVYMQSGSAWQIDTAVDGRFTGESIFQILKEIDGIRENITPKELDFAKTSSIKKFPLLFETYSQVARNISLIPMYDLPENYFDKYIDNISGVDLDSALEAAYNNFRPQDLAVIAVGNAEQIKSQLVNLKGLEIIECDSDGNFIG